MSRKHGPARGVRGFVRRFLQRPGAADLRRARRIAAAVGAPGSVPAEGAWGDAEIAAYLAVAREAAEKALGERPFDVQLEAAAALLLGHVVEMATGEGKTLVGAIAAAGYARQGRRVHVISVNDYLARRDAEWMGPLLAELEVSAGWVGAATADRRAAYAHDVVYVPVNEVGFDVLRDRLVTDLDDVIVPEPDVAVVDEADSVLVDSSRVPLVLAGDVDAGVVDAEIVAIVRRLRPEIGR